MSLGGLSTGSSPDDKFTLALQKSRFITFLPGCLCNMRVYRIAKTKHIRNLSGTGARIHGGRWNRKGIGILLSISSLEIHAPIIQKVISTSELPANWYDYPGLSDLAELGTNWVLANDSLLLRVPSAVIKHEFNILINPSHPDMSHVTISHVEEFTFDERLLL